MPAELPRQWPLEIDVGMEMDLERTLNLLGRGGYEREYTVEGWGKFALRGGILDIFPSTSERPVRIELEADRVASLREFNVVTQRSSTPLENLDVFPASERGRARLRWTGHAGGSDRVGGGPRTDRSEGRGVLFRGGDRDTRRLRRREVGYGPFGRDHGESLAGRGGISRRARQGVSGDLDAAVETWRSLSSGGSEVFLLLDSNGQIERARELWHEAGGRARAPQMGIGNLSRGFQIPDLNLALFTSADLVGRRARLDRAPRVAFPAARRYRASRSWKSVGTSCMLTRVSAFIAAYFLARRWG